MKQIYLLMLSCCGLSVVAQQMDVQKMRAAEANRYSKMITYNVNPNTLNYDLLYQRLELNLDPAARYISGDVTSHFKANSVMSEMYFDFSTNLTVSQVKYKGQPVSFSQLSTKEIKIQLGQSLAAGAVDSLTISYAGTPGAYGSAGDAFAISTQGGTPVLYTLNEPYGAQEWFPTKQSMNDKIEKVDLVITTPGAYSVAGNGKLVSETTLPDGKRRTFWQTNYPIPAYLIAVGITNYVKINDTMGTPPFPFVNYVYPSTANNNSAMNNIAWTKEAMNLFETYFGPYPYREEKYGHMQFNWGGGMEHATMSSMGSFGKGLIAHELAHQWFGDKVTCKTWNEIWLNEGFATFGEHLVNEKLLMSASQFQNYLQGEMDYITSSAGGSVYVADSQLGNTDAVFSGRLSYSKAGYVVRMMKWILGEEVFYQALKDFHNRPQLAYSYAGTEDLENSVLQTSGVDLSGFFQDWIYGQGYPSYQIKWNQTTAQQLVIKVNQTQSHSSVNYFELPLPVRIKGTNGEVLNLKLENSMNGQSFTVPVNFTVSTVTFNDEKHLVTRNSTVTKDGTLLSATDPTAEKMAVFPNPVRDLLYIKGLKNTEQFEIYSIDGKQILDGKTSNMINVRSLPAGLYLLKLDRQTFKFIKE
ncbi:T9SS type A sorting domain-containing protein [Chryseobacterium salipaludis]|uniref:M1 family aminopeptidase n=1 Tax=Chryseobacterium TaxID=59732 RepID=UPI001FF50017|nr:MULTISPECIES: M1 family aminopeptidase [Chryseobacterium]MCJ8496766.1 T9SS type A sorting domain-containing protein [Chryseobacterium salipaludis]MCX3296247.1 M1 family aminopeptidase [Planobacterium sp. JC490]